MEHPSFKIGSRSVGTDFEPLVIAEIGINHNGDLEVAKEMVDAAAIAGIEVVKHQTHIVEDEMTPNAQEVLPGNSDRSIYSIMEECALDRDEEMALMEYVQSKGMIFISTPFSRKAADRLEEMNVPAYKIGSGECNNLPLLKHIAAFGKPVILSTGMNDIKSVQPSVQLLRESKVPFALLHTTNLYPTPDDLVRLGAIVDLQQHFPDAVVGLSDHTLTNHACFGAVALGASILERHFTDTMDRQGPDIICSMDTENAKELIEGSRILAKQRGGHKSMLEAEEVTRQFAFASVCSLKDIAKGEKFSMSNLWVKRPGNGEIPASEFESILGAVAAKDIKKDRQLKWSDIQS